MKKVFKSDHPSRGEITQEMFLKYFTRELKKNLTTRSPIKSTEHILIAYSGGFSSTCLLNILEKIIPKDPIILKKRKNMSFQYSIIYIDTNSLFKTLHTCEDIETYIKKNFLNVKNIFMHKISQRFLKIIESVHELSAKEDIYRILIEEEIIDFARNKGFEKVLVGHSANRIAVQCISGICKGNASKICNYVKIERNIDGIKIVRPMKSFLSKEIVYYCNVYSLKTFFTPDFSTMKNVKNSTVDKLVEYYLNRVMKVKSDTIFTILRTVERLKNEQTDQKCRICKCNLNVKEINSEICFSCEKNIPSCSKYAIEQLMRK